MAKYDNGWTDVKECHPAYFKTVLVYAMFEGCNGYYTKMALGECYFEDNKIKWSIEGGRTLDYVIAWRNLPKIPHNPEEDILTNRILRKI